MTSHLSTKETLAQLRTEKEECNNELRLGILNATNLFEAYERLQSQRCLGLGCHDEANALLGQANRAYELLKSHPDHHAYWILE
jgi:hypothetical protein